MMSGNPTHPTKARPAGTCVLSGERLTRGVRRVAGVRAQLADRGSYCGSELAGMTQGAEPWAFTSLAHPQAVEGLRAIGSSLRDTRGNISTLPATPVSARRADAKDRRGHLRRRQSVGGTP